MPKLQSKQFNTKPVLTWQRDRERVSLKHISNIVETACEMRKKLTILALNSHHNATQ